MRAGDRQLDPGVGGRANRIELPSSTAPASLRRPLDPVEVLLHRLSEPAAANRHEPLAAETEGVDRVVEAGPASTGDRVTAASGSTQPGPQMPLP